MKVYKMPNGRKYQFSEGNQPAGAVPVIAEKSIENPINKSISKPVNKAKKAVKK